MYSKEERCVLCSASGPSGAFKGGQIGGGAMYEDKDGYCTWGFITFTSIGLRGLCLYNPIAGSYLV